LNDTTGKQLIEPLQPEYPLLFFIPVKCVLYAGESGIPTIHGDARQYDPHQLVDCGLTGFRSERVAFREEDLLGRADAERFCRQWSLVGDVPR